MPDMHVSSCCCVGPLQEQFQAQAAGLQRSQLFAGVAIHVNGLTSPSHLVRAWWPGWGPADTCCCRVHAVSGRTAMRLQGESAAKSQLCGDAQHPPLLLAPSLSTSAAHANLSTRRS